MCVDPEGDSKTEPFRIHSSSLTHFSRNYTTMTPTTETDTGTSGRSEIITTVSQPRTPGWTIQIATYASGMNEHSATEHDYEAD